MRYAVQDLAHEKKENALLQATTKLLLASQASSFRASDLQLISAVAFAGAAVLD